MGMRSSPKPISRRSLGVILFLLGVFITEGVGWLAFAVFSGAGHGTTSFGDLFLAPMSCGQIVVGLAWGLLPWRRNRIVTALVVFLIGVHVVGGLDAIQSGGFTGMFSREPFWAFSFLGFYLACQIAIVLILASR